MAGENVHFFSGFLGDSAVNYSVLVHCEQAGAAIGCCLQNITSNWPGQVHKQTQDASTEVFLPKQEMLQQELLTF